LVFLQAATLLLVQASPVAEYPDKVIVLEQGSGEKVPIDMNLLPRIVGGQDARMNEFPFMAYMIGINNDNTQNLCGTSILNANYMLTAAHCIDSPKLQYVQVVVGDHSMQNQGETNAQRLWVSEITIHNYNPNTIENDIAIMKLSSPITFTNTIQPACLASGSNQYVGWTATAMGWGGIYHDGPTADILQKLNLEVISPSECQTMGGSSSTQRICVVDRSQNKGACHGDSGGPLVVYENGKYRQVGIASYITSRCGTAGKPTVYVRVTAYRSWIQQQVGSTLAC